MTHSFPPRMHCFDYKAEAATLVVDKLIRHCNKPKTFSNICRDCSPSTPKHKEDIPPSPLEAAHRYSRTVTKNGFTGDSWPPPNSRNESADTLVKQGSSMPQDTTETTLEEAKTYIKAAGRIRWTKEHPSFSAHE
ncbi:hypothetical protein PoB_003450700 [Plakobranchus ocellatus]|uniref:Uncharacterized protein n=1 Tax=Plakobranchus ocellatus TaxID=259542 RepID=A0AAV4AL85_9GAST|nr:hypothetical protein PoB_003450700 [Plakobranchus ocellatus]